MRVQEAAQELAGLRTELEGDWTGCSEDLEDILGEAALAGAMLAESAVRMDVDGATRRSRCAEAIRTALENVRQPYMELG